MSNVLGRLSQLVVERPWLTLFILLNITVFLGAGAVRRAPLPDDLATIPEESAVAVALAGIDEHFGDAGDASVATVVFRGNAFTPPGLAQMDALLGEIVSEPAIAGLFTPVDPVVAPSLALKAAMRVDSFAGVTQAQIDAARSVPQVQAALAALTGVDTDGTEVAIAIIRLRDTGDERFQTAQRGINEAALASDGPLRASSVSAIVIDDAFRQATREGRAILSALTLLLIAGLTLLFMRTLSDLLLTLAGLVMALVWIIGAEGWLGPYALGLTGPPNSLTAVVPIVVMSLTVDYAIQIVSHYREQRHSGEPVAEAVRKGLNNVTVPLALAAVTTMVSLFVSLFSPIAIVGDFGVIAGLGVGMTLIVMLTLVPAGRTLIDRRREARGTLTQPRLIAAALPGVGRLAELLGRGVARRPLPYLLAVLAITIGLGWVATGVQSDFDIRDALPRGGSVITDMNTIEAAIGGSTEIVSVLVDAEATETRTLLNFWDLTAAFADEQRRPSAASGPILASYESLLRDWTHDSGQPGDKYDPEMAALYAEASAGLRLDAQLMQELLDRLQARDPTLAHLLANNPNGGDALLFQFPAYSNDPAQTRALQQEVEALWRGDDAALTATSERIITFAITDAITEGQTEAVVTIIAAALSVLAFFFWVTARQPALAIIAVGPIVIALISVLGTMALLGIPYSLVTSVIAALSIGIGVDYTIHMIHRYREEYARLRDPEQAAIRTLSVTGSALLGSALTTAIGIGALVLSSQLMFQQFAITAAITILYSLVVSVLVVPPAMTVWGAYQNMRLRSRVRNWAQELDQEIEETFRRREREEGTA